MNHEKIWDAVETAINYGMSVEQFRRVCAVAWEATLRQRTQSDEKAWRAGKTR